jgi:hydrogen peroxide-dependent heme synthase
MTVIPPATLEGWYALHQVVSFDWGAVQDLVPEERERLAEEAGALMARLERPSDAGWSAAFQIVGGGGADWMLVHFRESLETLADVQLTVRRSAVGPFLATVYDYVSVTEAGLYHATAQAAAEADQGSEAFETLLAERVEAERGSQFMQSRLYPKVPEGMPYVSFYPMTKRRVHPDNWYTLPVAERNRMMREHGLTGRRYAGRIFQVITGSVGIDDWEWGVTLFARDLLDIKRIVTEMRYDEASSRYGEFGAFYVGVQRTAAEWAKAIRAE